MKTKSLRLFLLLEASSLGLTACGGSPAAEGSSMQAFVGARIIDGTGGEPIERGVIIVQDGAIQAVGAEGAVEIPDGATVIDVEGRTIIPGLINTHGHVGGARGLETGQYSRENALDQLGLYARYGVTTVVSLGGDGPEGIQIREEQSDSALNRSRLFVAGPVVAAQTPEEAVTQVQEVAAMGVDWVKFRVDDNLDTATKMPPEVYQAIIQEAHRQGIPAAVHLVELEDAKALVQAGVDILAHSVRDVPVDEELVNLMRERRICLIPTLTRDLSTFVYGSRPAFFDDAFFLEEADPAVLEALEDPARQSGIREDAAAQYWQAQLPLAQQNMKTLLEGGAGIAMGTDTGQPGRFQGYFEHLEMEMMAEAGLTPMQVLVSATGEAARCMGLDVDLGTIEPGKRADLVVLQANPLSDIRNTRTIESVWINGNQVPERNAQ